MCGRILASLRSKGRLQAVVFCLIVAAICLGPGAFSVATRTGVPVPDWVASPQAKYLEGGTTDAHPGAHLSLSGFRSKELQKAIEGDLGNHIPAKAAVLLGNAALQRGAIAASNWLFNWPCYQTYFDSHILALGKSVVDGAAGAAGAAGAGAGSDSASTSDENTTAAECFIPLQNIRHYEESLRKLGEIVAGLSAEYPAKEFRIVLAEDSRSFAGNPGAALSSDTVSTQAAAEILERAISNTYANANAEVVVDTPRNLQEYYKKYYKTDHHWNGWGALAAYEKAVAGTEVRDQTRDQGDQSESNFPQLKELKWLRENGAYAREGLLLLNEAVNEPQIPGESFNILKGKTPLWLQDAKDELKVETAALGHSNPLLQYDFYQEWYGGWENTLVKNPQATHPNAEALVICDSFGTAFKWIASTDFGTVSSTYDLHYNSSYPYRLRETIKKTQANTVFIVARVENMGTVLNRFPYYLDRDARDFID